MYLLKKKRASAVDANDHYVPLADGDGAEEEGGGGRERKRSTSKKTTVATSAEDNKLPLLQDTVLGCPIQYPDLLGEEVVADFGQAQQQTQHQVYSDSSFMRDGFEGWDTGEVDVNAKPENGSYKPWGRGGVEEEIAGGRDGVDVAIDVSSLVEAPGSEESKAWVTRGENGGGASFEGWIDPVSDGWAGPPNNPNGGIWVDQEKQAIDARDRNADEMRDEEKDGSVSDDGLMTRFSERLLMFLGRPPSLTYGPINPFSSRTPHISGIYEWTKTIICLPLFVLRVLLIVFTIAIGYVWTKPILLGSDNVPGPMPTWRRTLMYGTRLCGRSIMFAMGFLWIHRKGTRAPRSVAPIVVSNHVSFVDPIFFFYDLMPTIVSSKSHESLPLLGTIIKAMRVIGVDRENPDSRKVAAAEIKRKASDPGWPHLLLFPEGTTTNGRAVVSFKLGAFLPGLPIQPVVVRYPHVHLDPSWGVDVSMPSLLFRMMTQFYNILEVEYLPVMTPTEREKAYPAAFAERVRHAMAESLNVTCTDHTYGDVLLAVEAAQLNLSPASLVVVEMGKMEKLFNLTRAEAKQFLDKFSAMDPNRSGHVTIEKFLTALDLPSTTLTKQIFYLFDRSERGYINFREFVAGLAFISKHTSFAKTIEAAFRTYDQDMDGSLSRSELQESLKMVFPAMGDKKVVRLFDKLDLDRDGVISWEEFRTFLQRNPEHLAVFVAARPDIMLAKEIRHNSDKSTS